MTVREQLEEREYENLSIYARKSRESLGRKREEAPCDIRPAFQRDRDRILHSKAFRRMKHKTQVFLAPVGDHYRTRLTHTLEVSQNARTIAKALRLNEDLAEAIALGHDVGHTPFGHAGERALNELASIGFSHARQSVRALEVLEKDGEGLNLTMEVLDGIENHRLSGHPMTLEGKIVQYSDKIAYLHHDIDDAIRAGLIKNTDIPAGIRAVLGESSDERLKKLTHSIIENSRAKNAILMDPVCREAMMSLRCFMFQTVYQNERAMEQEKKVLSLMSGLYRYYTEHMQALPEEYARRAEGGKHQAEASICDYIAGMTDQYAVEKFEELYIPKSWKL